MIKARQGSVFVSVFVIPGSSRYEVRSGVNGEKTRGETAGLPGCFRKKTAILILVTVWPDSGLSLV